MLLKKGEGNSKVEEGKVVSPRSRRGRVRKGAERRAGVREAARGGGGLLGRRRRGSRRGEIRGILQFEPIKSMVSRGLSPEEAGFEL